MTKAIQGSHMRLALDDIATPPAMADLLQQVAHMTQSFRASRVNYVYNAIIQSISCQLRI
jgi:hypothetical protein